MLNKSNEKLEISESSGNVFADLEIPNAEKHLAKAELARQVNNIIKTKGWKQAKAAEILGIDQPKISALNCGRLNDFSVERLISFLNMLDQDVQIIVKAKPKQRKNHGHLTVVFA